MMVTRRSQGVIKVRRDVELRHNEAGPLPLYDPECEAALAAIAATGEDVPELASPEDIPVMRGWMDRALGAIAAEALAAHGGYTTVERQVQGPDGQPEITLLICTPVDLAAPAPAIYHIHGGGMVLGDRRTSIMEILDLAEPLGAVVVSVEYRLAPEHPDPAPVEDCYAGLTWTVAHAAELGVDPERIVIAGASAGGGLAAGTALLARDRGGPALAGQLLMCPMLDDRNNSVSAVQSYDKGPWPGVANGVGWRALLGDRQGGSDVSVYAAPARATDLSGLPPALLDVGSAEVFRSETGAYAERIWSCGGVAELHVWPGGYHGYDMFAPRTLVSQATIEARQLWLRRLLATV
jgi:acetyl esterase/lipase